MGTLVYAVLSCRCSGGYDRCESAGVARGPFPLLSFVVVQCADAWLTTIGIHRFGFGIEANPILSWYAYALGAGVTIFGAKALAVGCAAALHYQGRYRTLSALSALYVVAAIIPWLVVLWI